MAVSASWAYCQSAHQNNGIPVSDGAVPADSDAGLLELQTHGGAGGPNGVPNGGLPNSVVPDGSEAGANASNSGSMVVMMLSSSCPDACTAAEAAAAATTAARVDGDPGSGGVSGSGVHHHVAVNGGHVGGSSVRLIGTARQSQYDNTYCGHSQALSAGPRGTTGVVGNGMDGNRAVMAAAAARGGFGALYPAGATEGDESDGVVAMYGGEADSGDGGGRGRGRLVGTSVLGALNTVTEPTGTSMYGSGLESPVQRSTGGGDGGGGSGSVCFSFSMSGMGSPSVTAGAAGGVAAMEGEDGYGNNVSTPTTTPTPNTPTTAAADGGGGSSHGSSAFRPYQMPTTPPPPLSRPRDAALLVRATAGLVALYRHCNDAYRYSQNTNPRRVLTKPSAGLRNDGYDNENSDLILHVNDVLVNGSPGAVLRRYVVHEMLGQGTFGQVVACWCEERKALVAVKVIKNQPAYYHQARVEIGLLQLLNTRCDPADQHRIVRMVDFFLFRKHLCLVFEKLDVNLFELLRRNGFRGLSLSLVQMFLRQLLDALVVLRDASIIHCDIKPENILLKSPQSGDLKLIDFGSACFENRTVYSYIQSRFYRSPEVVLGCGYNVAIDVWSLGCVAAELFLGLPLFPGASEHDLLTRIVQTFGMPPAWLLDNAKHADKFFNKRLVPDASGQLVSQYVLTSQAEFETKNNCKAPAGKRYFSHTSLPDIILVYPFKQNLGSEELDRERRARECFIDFLLGVLELDPRRRWTPRQAAAHPFITGEAFTGPFTPQPDPPRKSPHLLSYLPAESTPPVAVRSAITHQYQQQNQQQFTAGTSVGKATASSAAASHQAVGSLGAFGNSAAMPTAPTSAGLPSASTPAAAAGRGMALPFANARTAASAAFGSLPSHGSESGLNQLHNASHSLSHLHGHLQAPYLPQQQHHHHQQAAFIPGSSYTAPGGGGTAAMSMLQYSPAHHAQAHAQAHAIAMAALQQLSPNFSSMLAGSYVQGGGGGGASGCGMAASLGSSWQHPPSSQLLSGSFQTPGLAGSVPHALPPALGSSLSSHLPVVGSFPSGAYQGASGAATGQLSGAGGPPPLPPIQLGATPSTASFMQHHIAPWAAARAQQQQQLQQHLQQQQLQQQLQQQQQQLQQQGGLPSGIAAAAMVGNRRLSSSHATELVYSPAVATAAAAAATAAAAAAQQQQQHHALSLSGVGLASGEGSERISGGGAGSAPAAAASAGTGNGQSSGGAAADALNAAAAAAAAARHQQSQLVQQQMQIQAAVAAVAAAAAAATAGGPSVYGTAGAGGQSDAIGSAAAAAAAAAVFGGSAGSGLPGTPQHAALLSSSLSQGNPAGGLDPLFMGALLQQQQKQQHDAVTSAAAAAAVAAAAAAASGGASSASHAAGLHLLNYTAGQQPLPHHHMHLQSHQHPHSQRQNPQPYPQPYPQPPGSFQHSYPTHPNNLLSSHHHHSHISQGGLAAQAAQVAASLAALHAQSGTLQPPYPGGPPFMMPHALGAAAAAASAAAGMGHIPSHMALGAFGTVGAGGIGPPVPGGQSMLGVGGASAGGLVGAGLPHGGSFTSTTDNTDALFEMQTGATESGTSQQSLPGRNVPSTPADSPSINQVGSPGDWDPLYSDEQLLGEELPAALGGDYVRHNGRQGGARRRGSVSYSDIMLAQRPHDPTSGAVPPLLLQPEVQAQQPHAAMQHGPAVAGGPATAAAAAAAAMSATVSAEAVGASVAAYRGSSAMMQSTPPPDRRSPSVGVCSDAYGRRSAMDWSSTPGLDVTGGTTGTGVGHGGHHPGMGPAGLGPAGGDVGHGDDEDTVGDSGVGGPGGGGGGNATPAVLGGADVPDVIAPGGSGGGGLCSTVHLASGDPGGGGGGASGSAGSGQGAAMGALGGIAHALLAAQQQQHQHTLGRFTTSGLGTAGTARLASSSGRPYGSSDGSGTVNMGGGAAVTAATTSASADGYWTAAMSSTLVNGGGSIAIPTPGTTPQYHPLYDTGALAAIAAAGSLQAPLMLAGSFQPLSSHYLLQQQQQQQQYLQQASQVRYALQQQQQQQTALALEAAVGASTAGGGAHDTLSGMIRAHGSATTASASCEDLAGAFAAAVQQHQHQQQQQHQHQQQILQQLVASQHPAPTHHHTNQLQMQQQQHTQQQQGGAEMAALQPIESAAAAAAVAAAAFEQHQRQQQHQQMYVGSLPYSGLMPPVMSMLRQSEGQH